MNFSGIERSPAAAYDYFGAFAGDVETGTGRRLVDIWIFAPGKTGDRREIWSTRLRFSGYSLLAKGLCDCGCGCGVRSVCRFLSSTSVWPARIVALDIMEEFRP